jgi:large subunit ribosomal protein L17
VNLVDGPRDVKFEMVARTIGRERAIYAAGKGIADYRNVIENEGLSERTINEKEKVMRYQLDQLFAEARMHVVIEDAAVST